MGTSSSMTTIKTIFAVALLVVALTAAFDDRVDEDFLESNPESSLVQALRPHCHKKCLWRYMRKKKKGKKLASLAQASRRLPKRRRRTRRTICRRYYRWVRAKKHKVRCIHKKVVRCKYHKTKRMKFHWRSYRRCYREFYRKFCRTHRVPSYRHVYARKCHHHKRKVCYKYKPMRKIISTKCYKLLLKCHLVDRKGVPLKFFHKCRRFRTCRHVCKRRL